MTVVVLVLPGAARDRSTWLPPLTALLVPLALLAPWWVGSLRRGAAEALLLDPGRLPAAEPSGLQLLAGRLTDTGAPWWLGLVLVVLALLALVPRPTRAAVLLVWVVALVSVLVALALSVVRLELVVGTAAPGVAAPLAVLAGALVTAVVLGGVGARETAARPLLVGLGLVAAIDVASANFFILEYLAPTKMRTQRLLKFP